MKDTLAIFELGSKAYYNEVPRYKNPYCDEVYNDGISAHKTWNEGWKRASQEHNLFTENQGLKEETQSLKGHISELSLANMDEILVLQKSARKMISLISRDAQTIINHRGFINERDDQINALIDRVKKLSKFTFSREKMIIEIKKILNMVHSHLEVISPEVKKNNPK